ncbi:MAG: hypothetical protein IJY89_02025 [Clostridia bacterium]|nr:hypothetical protein [Clostridia bacterium]
MNKRHFKGIVLALLLAALAVLSCSCFSLPAKVLIESAEWKLSLASSFTVHSSLSLSVPSNKKPILVSEEGLTEYYGLKDDSFTYYSKTETTVTSGSKTSTSGRIESFEKGTHYLETSENFETVNTRSASISQEEFLEYLHEGAIDFQEFSPGKFCDSAVYKFTNKGTAAVVYSDFNEEGIKKFSALTQNIDSLFSEKAILSDVRITMTATLAGSMESVRIEFVYEGEDPDALPSFSVENRYERINKTKAYVFTPSRIKKYIQCDDLRILRRADSMLSDYRNAEEGQFRYTQNESLSYGKTTQKEFTSGTVVFGNDEDGFFYTAEGVENGSTFTKSYKNGRKTTVISENNIVTKDETVTANASAEHTLLKDQMVPFFFDGRIIKGIQKTEKGWSITFKEAVVGISLSEKYKTLDSAGFNITL